MKENQVEMWTGSVPTGVNKDYVAQVVAKRGWFVEMPTEQQIKVLMGMPMTIDQIFDPTKDSVVDIITGEVIHVIPKA